MRRGALVLPAVLALAAVALWWLGEPAELAAHRRLMRIVAADPVLAPFVSDGCSGGLSAAWPGGPPPWETCCIAHDRIYHRAGDARTAGQSLAARARADAGLRACVLAEGRARRAALAAAWGVPPARVDAIHAVAAAAMYRAVRLGGAPCTGLPWRWGYGFADCGPGG